MNACRVCGRGADPGGHCRWCGWEEVVDGAAPGADPFEDRLQEMRRHYDERAALRVAALGGRLDRSLITRLELFVRHGPVVDEERLLLARQIEAERAQRRPTAPFDQVVRDALERLVAGVACGIAVFDVGPHGVRWLTIAADAIGTPRLDPAGWAGFDWDAVVAGLSADPDERQFQLAGGHGSRPLDMDEVDRALWADASLRDASALRDCWIRIVLESAPGWAVADRAASVLAERGASIRAQRPGPSASVLDAIAALVDDAPIRHPYELVLAIVEDGSGRVRIDTRTLFPRGATRSTAPWVGAIEALPSHLQRLSLPIVVKLGSSPSDWYQVDVQSVELPAGSAARVTIALSAPGQVRFTSLRDLRPDGRTWQELYAVLPERVNPRGAPTLDLVCAVELAGDPQVVQRRVRRVEEIVDGFATALQGGLRVGLVGYHDHVFSPDQVEPDPLVDALPLAEPAATLSGMRRWTLGSELRHDYGAPLEDALATLEDMVWRDSRRRVLIVLAGRPPHPMRQQADPGLPCPHRHDWRFLLGRNNPLTCMAVTSPPQFPPDAGLIHRADEAWRTLGQASCVPLDAHDLVDRLLAGAGIDPNDRAGAVPLATAMPGATP